MVMTVVQSVSAAVSNEPVDIAAWLTEQGFVTDASRAAARKLLENAGFTNPRKRAIAQFKLPAATALLDKQAVLVCAPCSRFAETPRHAVESDAAHCSVCKGSNNRRAAMEMAAVCRMNGVDRLLVIGGSNGTIHELETLLNGTRLALRCVDGVDYAPNKKRALPDLNWAQFVVVWASTPLPHKVSVSYTDECPPDVRMITVARRSVEALCGEVTKSLGLRR